MCLKIILASKQRLSWVSWKPEQITDTSISVKACLGDAKCQPTGRSVLVCCVEHKCSLNQSPRRLPVSPMYTLLQVRHLIRYTMLLFIQVYLELMVMCPPVSIVGGALVWAQVHLSNKLCATQFFSCFTH